MKKISLVAFVCAAFWAFAVTPSVDPASISVSQDVAGGPVKIAYTLANGPAIVTVDVQTNAGGDAWASVGDTRLGSLCGDVNRIVGTDEPANLSAWWMPAVDMPDGGTFTAANVRAIVTAWATNSPPDYMVFDTMDGTRRYFTSAAALPLGGLTNDLCRKEYMVFRKVTAANIPWRWGASNWEQEKMRGKATTTNNWAHIVTLTKDYYLGVFEVTVGQYKRIKPDASFGNDQFKGMGAASGISYNSIRGSSAGAGWPNEDPAVARAVDSGSFLYAMRALTNNELLFDLPTEAQWEYACRAGVTNTWYNGKNAYNDGYTSDSNLGTAADGYNCIAFYYSLCYDSKAPFYSQRYPHHVGKFIPNAWGFYDMLGNVNEWCLDWYDTHRSRAAETDPAGPATGTIRVYKGGCFVSWAQYVRAAARSGFAPNRSDIVNGYSTAGFRVCLTLD